MNRPRIAGFAAIAIVLAAALGFVLWDATGSDKNAAASVGGPFTLTDYDGRRVTQDILLGRPTALFFGYTHCPEVCPTTVGNLEYWMSELGPKADDLQIFFVTVDPERDTPAVLSDYLRAQSDRVRGLTGTPQETAQMLKAWRVYAKKVPLEGGSYSMDHSSMIYLLDRKGGYFGSIGYGEDDTRAISSLRRLIDKG